MKKITIAIFVISLLPLHSVFASSCEVSPVTWSLTATTAQNPTGISVEEDTLTSIAIPNIKKWEDCYSAALTKSKSYLSTSWQFIESSFVYSGGTAMAPTDYSAQPDTGMVDQYSSTIPTKGDRRSKSAACVASFSYPEVAGNSKAMVFTYRSWIVRVPAFQPANTAANFVTEQCKNVTADVLAKSSNYTTAYMTVFLGNQFSTMTKTTSISRNQAEDFVSARSSYTSYAFNTPIVIKGSKSISESVRYTGGNN